MEGRDGGGEIIMIIFRYYDYCYYIVIVIVAKSLIIVIFTTRDAEASTLKPSIHSTIGLGLQDEAAETGRRCKTLNPQTSRESKKLGVVAGRRGCAYHRVHVQNVKKKTMDLAFC